MGNSVVVNTPLWYPHKYLADTEKRSPTTHLFGKPITIQGSSQTEVDYNPQVILMGMTEFLNCYDGSCLRVFRCKLKNLVNDTKRLSFPIE